jgi:hypothetical protein
MSQLDPTGKNEKNGEIRAEWVDGKSIKFFFTRVALGAVGLAFLILGLLVTVTLLPCVTTAQGAVPVILILFICAMPLLIGAVFVYVGIRVRGRN